MVRRHVRERNAEIEECEVELGWLVLIAYRDVAVKRSNHLRQVKIHAS
jgi:hypothetical protein